MSDENELFELASDLKKASVEVTSRYQRTNERVDGLQARFDDFEQRAARRGSHGDGGEGQKSLGRTVVDSEQFKNFRDTMGRAGRVRIPVLATHLKALITTASGGGALVGPDRSAGIIALPQRATIRSLLAPGNTTTNAVEFARETVFTNAAAPVSEGGLKQESSIEYELVNAPVRTIAHWVPVSKQALDDAPALQSQIDSTLRYGLALVEEQQMLFGDGTGENILGMVPQATAYDDSGDTDPDTTRADVLLHAVAQAEVALLPATGVILNTRDWYRLLGLKDENGRYLGAGPFAPLDSRIWDLPKVATPAMPEGDFMVGAFGIAAQIFDREEANVVLSSEDRDNFIRNRVTILAEERLALAVRRPQALIYGSFGAISG